MITAMKFLSVDFYFTVLFQFLLSWCGFWFLLLLCLGFVVVFCCGFWGFFFRGGGLALLMSLFACQRPRHLDVDMPPCFRLLHILIDMPSLFTIFLSHRILC